MSALRVLFPCLAAALAACSPVHAASAVDAFDAYLAAPFAPADGFEPPLGGRTARVIGTGRVIEAAPGIVVVGHVFYENHRRRVARSTYAGLSNVDVAVGQDVARGQRVGVRARDAASRINVRVDVEAVPPAADEPVDPRRFIAERRHLFVPQREPRLVLVDHDAGQLRLYERGRLAWEAGVGFGQADGNKEELGDLRTPRGMYFVVGMSRGPFAGPYADYYAGHWIKLNYPGRADADRGLAAGLVSSTERDAITARWDARKLTPQGTRLGGGIGFHGWIEPWDAGSGRARLSWGCVVLQPSDIAVLYERVEEGTMVVIF